MEATKELISKEIKNIPDCYLEEVLDFIRFIKTKTLEEKAGEKMDLALMSETSLKKDWLRPEEDEAWKYL